jgi:CHAD domain-containing protein
VEAALVSTLLPSDEPILSGVRRILVEQLENICSVLQSKQLSDDGVHAIRKELKRARASLRLLREALGADEYRQLNQQLRDVARSLTTMRDATVLLQTLDKVTAKADELSGISVASELRDSLQEELLLHRNQLKAKDIEAIRHSLDAAGNYLRTVSDASLDEADVNAAIRCAHRKARKAFKMARREPSSENLHEWRKQVKYELNQLELLRPLGPKRIGAIIRRARKISDRLGDDHDLAILRERIMAHFGKNVGATAEVEALLKVVDSMRSRLQKKVRHLGKKLHGQKSRHKLEKVAVAIC